ncbi:MAG: general secretion pathway protein GspK [Puniceicoccales bacterium]|nr:general secretion pathway protein GspK [Puniceicoccales bacterium]
MPKILRRDGSGACQGLTPAGGGVRRPARRRAAAFVLVLIAAAFLGFVATEIIAGGVRLLSWETRRSGHDELRREAFSALESTLGVLAVFARTDGALHGPAQGWGDPLVFSSHVAAGGVGLTVTLRDESGLYGLNALAADTAAMRRFLSDVGIGESEAARLADCLADWTDAGDVPRANGAERDRYPEGVAPPNRPLRSLGELRDVLGFREVFFNEDGSGNDLWRRFSAAVSLLSESTRPNVNTAPRAVLEILAARHGFSPDAILQGRGDGEDSGDVVSTLSAGGAVPGRAAASGVVYRNASDLSRAGVPPALGAEVSFQCARLRILVRASRADAVVVLDTLLEMSTGAAGGAAQFPFTILQQRVDARLKD